MECIRVCVEEARELGMDAWLYDEDCWPSGSAGGRINAIGEDYCLKQLCREELRPGEFKPSPRTIAVFAAKRVGGELTEVTRLDPDRLPPVPPDRIILHFFYRVDTGYVDLLSKKVVRAFIDSTYERYYQRIGRHFGGTVPGIFTDEPQYRHPPWSFDLPRYFKEKKGYELLDVLPSLFYKIGDFSKVRVGWGRSFW